MDERSNHYFLRQIDLVKKVEISGQDTVYWVHVSSAGELEQAVPVLRYLHEHHSIYFFITYFSPSAKPFLTNVPGIIGSVSFPIDRISNHLKIIESAKIKHVLLVRYDIWPGILLACKKANLPISLLAASQNRAKKSWVGFLGIDTRRYFFSYLNSIFAVSESDTTYFKSLAPKAKVFFAGDPKWARAKERVNLLKKVGLHNKFGLFADLCLMHKNLFNRTCIVFGSPHQEEHEVALQCATLQNQCLILYAPGEMDTNTIQGVVSDFKKTGASVICYSEFLDRVKNENLTTKEDISRSCLASTVLIMDQMGILSEIYAFADVAIIGGGFDGQIHNTLEPAAHPVAVVFGNNLHRALEARQLVASEAAKSFDSPLKLFEFLSQCSTLRRAGAKELLFVTELASMRLHALELFGEMPNTNKIIAESLI